MPGSFVINLMKNRRTLQSLFIFGCLLFLSLWPVRGVGQETKLKVSRRTVKPNLIAPELYSDKLSLKITLMNLPGAATSTSYWEVEFQIVFVPEQDFGKTLKDLNKAGKGRELRPEYFPTRILLATGKFNKRSLDTLKKRAFVRHGIAFRNKVPAEQQTTYARLVSFYSVNVFDGKLKKDIYGSNMFVVPPFDTDTDDTSIAPRTHLFLNFFVAEDGSLYRSNTKSASESTEWNPN